MSDSVRLDLPPSPGSPPPSWTPRDGPPPRKGSLEAAKRAALKRSLSDDINGSMAASKFGVALRKRGDSPPMKQRPAPDAVRKEALEVRLSKPVGRSTLGPRDQVRKEALEVKLKDQTRRAKVAKEEVRKEALEVQLKDQARRGKVEKEEVRREALEVHLAKVPSELRGQEAALVKRGSSGLAGKAIMRRASSLMRAGERLKPSQLKARQKTAAAAPTTTS